MLKVLLFIVCCLYASKPFASPEAEFRLLGQVAQRVVSGFQFELAHKPRLVSVHRPEKTPVAATTTKSGQCVVILNTNPSSWSGWTPFLKSQTLSKEEVFQFAVLHEIGHCVNKASAKPLSPGLGSESFADAYAFFQLKSTLSDSDFLRHLDAIIEARKSMGFMSLFSGHNTSKTLESIRAEFLSVSAQAQLDSRF